VVSFPLTAMPNNGTSNESPNPSIRPAKSNAPSVIALWEG
jgi:hypothetical protein